MLDELKKKYLTPMGSVEFFSNYSRNMWPILGHFYVRIFIHFVTKIYNFFEVKLHGSDLYMLFDEVLFVK